MIVYFYFISTSADVLGGRVVWAPRDGPGYHIYARDA